MKQLTQHALFWPATTLLLLLAACALFNPAFLSIAWRDGHLYGNLIDILNRADDQHYTLIENGDCEELWFIRDFDAFRGFPQMVSDIIAKHQAIYTKLRDMHKRGRYFRLYKARSRIRTPRPNTWRRRDFPRPRSCAWFRCRPSPAHRFASRALRAPGWRSCRRR